MSQYPSNLSEICLAVVNPQLARQWNRDKNNGLLPDDVTANSGKKVWWICDRGHEWIACIRDRNRSGCGCSRCSENGVSRIEKRVFAELFSIFGGMVRHSEKIGGRREVDIFVQDANLGIEIDGYRWHRDKMNADQGKTIYLRSIGVDLVRIRQNPLPKLSSSDVLCDFRNQDSLFLAIAEIVDKISRIVGLDCSWYRLGGKFIGADKYCELISGVSYGSGEKVWWKCSNGHEWQASIHDQKGGCGFCYGKKATNNNCLERINPKLSLQWDYDKNVDCTPKDVMPNSHRKVWWRCEKGHGWISTIQSRSTGTGCPECWKERRTKMPS